MHPAHWPGALYRHLVQGSSQGKQTAQRAGRDRGRRTNATDEIGFQFRTAASTSSPINVAFGPLISANATPPISAWPATFPRMPQIVAHRRIVLVPISPIPIAHHLVEAAPIDAAGGFAIVKLYQRAHQAQRTADTRADGYSWPRPRDQKPYNRPALAPRGTRSSSSCSSCSGSPSAAPEASSPSRASFEG
jgi:hypothetical protein